MTAHDTFIILIDYLLVASLCATENIWREGAEQLTGSSIKVQSKRPAAFLGSRYQFNSPKSLLSGNFTRVTDCPCDNQAVGKARVSAGEWQSKDRIVLWLVTSRPEERA